MSDVRAGEKNKSSLQRWSLRNSGLKNAEKGKGVVLKALFFFRFWLMTGPRACVRHLKVLSRTDCVLAAPCAKAFRLFFFLQSLLKDSTNKNVVMSCVRHVESGWRAHSTV